MTRHNYKYLLVILAIVCLALPAYATIVGMMKMPDTSKKSNVTAKETPEGFGDQREGGGTRWIDPVILYNLQDVNRTDYTRAYDQGDIDVNKEIVEKGYKIYGIRLKPICGAGYVEKYAYLTNLGPKHASFSFSYQDVYGVRGVPINEAGFCIYPDEGTSRTYTFEYEASGRASDYTYHQTSANSITISGLQFTYSSNSGIAFSYALDGKAAHIHKCSDGSKARTFRFESQKGAGANAKFGHFIYFNGARDLLLMLGAPGKLPAGHSWATELRAALENHPWGRVYFIVEQVQVDAGVVAAVEGVELQAHESEKAEEDETEEKEVNDNEGEEAEDGESLPDEMIKAINQWLAGDPLGLDRQATPEEAVAIGSLAALLAILLGGAGTIGGGVGGALGGAIPPPIEGTPSGPPPIENPYQGVEDKYVTRHPDGSITVKDPITGEQRLYLPDGQGGYDNPLGGGYPSETDMLDHLAFLDRNRPTLSQDAETAARNQAEQHAQWEAQNARDQERGYSDAMADYRDWVNQQEHEIKKEERIAKLASEYGVAATEDAVKHAIKLDQIQAGIESAKQQAEAADNEVWIVGLQSTKNVAATSLVLIPMALSGVGTVSAATMAKAKIVQSCYTMAASVTDKVGDAYVKGENMAKATVHGVVLGTVGVVQSYAGDIGGMAAGKLAGNVSKLVQGTVNLGTEAAVVIGGEGFKKGYDEYTNSGDLNKTLNATMIGLKEGTESHLVNKTLEYGFDKVKGWASGKPTVEGTQAQVQATSKTVTTRQQAVIRTQNQVTSAQGRLNAAKQNVTRSQQQGATARGKVNTANEQLQTANKQVASAQQKLGQAKTPAEVSQARTELATAQQGAAQAQQNVNRANSELKTAERIDTATKRVAMNAENDLQKAQIGAQKAQSDLKTATEQHQQALRDANAAEQQAQIDKTVAPMSGSDIVGGLRAGEEHLKNEGYLPKDKD